MFHLLRFCCIALLTLAASACARKVPNDVVRLPGAIIMRPANLPPDTSLSQVRPYYRDASIPRCELPDVPIAADWKEFRSVDGGMMLRLPTGWLENPPEPANPPFKEPVARFASGSSRVWIERLSRGRIGPTFRANEATDPMPARYCERSEGAVGVIWTLYDADLIAAAGSPAAFEAYGEAVTRSRLRYKVRIRAPTDRERAELMAIISAAIRD